jgi:hypothetical protein
VSYRRTLVSRDQARLSCAFKRYPDHRRETRGKPNV